MRRDRPSVRSTDRERRGPRVYWDLRDTPSTRVTFRTSPLYAPEIRVGPDGIRESEGGFGAGGGGLSVLQAPGTYTVKLTAGGRDYTRPLRVAERSAFGGTEADITAQQQMLDRAPRYGRRGRCREQRRARHAASSGIFGT